MIWNKPPFSIKPPSLISPLLSSIVHTILGLETVDFKIRRYSSWDYQASFSWHEPFTRLAKLYWKPCLAKSSVSMIETHAVTDMYQTTYYTWYAYIWLIGISPFLHTLPWEPASLQVSISALLLWLRKYTFSRPVVLPCMWYQNVKQFLTGTVRRLSKRALSPFARGNEDSMYINFSVSERMFKDNHTYFVKQTSDS